MKKIDQNYPSVVLMSAFESIDIFVTSKTCSGDKDRCSLYSFGSGSYHESHLDRLFPNGNSITVKWTSIE